MGFQTDVRDGIVFLVVEGEWTLEMARQAQTELAGLIEKHGIYDLLVDLRAADSNPTTLQVFKVTASHADVFPSQTRHAVVLPGIDPEMRQFAETVAFNRGVQQKIFAAVDEALAWLAET